MWIGLCWIVFCAFFFRNPPRRIPQESAVVVSPADGRIVGIEAMDDPYFDRGRMQRVSIFLSVANVHVNRTPLEGIIEKVQYIPGRFLMAFRPKASTDNERNAAWIRGKADGEEAIMVQIAGTIARRIVWYLEEGAHVARGSRCGLIRFGSRVDLYLPLHCRLQVTRGDCVKGGRSLIGTFTEGGTQ